MAIALEQKNLVNYLKAFQERVTRRTNINLFDKDSKTQALIDIFSDQLKADRGDAVSAFNALQVTQASGQQLDSLGETKGVSRLSETFASVHRSELCLAFYVQSGTFGALNGSTSFTIPKGTKIASDAKHNDLGKVITYILLEDVACNSTDVVAYASARAEASGSESNVGSSVLRNHNFNSYSARTGLLVINFYSILNGRNRETDDHYRFRIAQLYTSIATTNEIKAKLIAVGVPGVIDTRVIPGHFGIGTIGLVILGTEFQSNNVLIDSVQSALNSVNLPGVKVSAIPAVNALIDLEVRVKTQKTLSASEQARVKNNLKRFAVNYFRSKGLGGTVSLSDLASLWAKNTNGQIQFRSSTMSIFDNVFIRRGYVSVSASERETLAGNTYSLALDEFADLGTLDIVFE